MSAVLSSLRIPMRATLRAGWAGAARGSTRVARARLPSKARRSISRSRPLATAGTTRPDNGSAFRPSTADTSGSTRSDPPRFRGHCRSHEITYLWTQEGWLYLAVILDLFSRAIVGWALSTQITRQLPLQALTMALGRRHPPPGLLHHSDRGSQYASADYRRALRGHGIVCSMSRRGNCWDNAVAESFFATLKVELAHEATWATRGQARSEVFEYIEQFYNGQRRHSALGYLSPITFERRWATASNTGVAAAAIAEGAAEKARAVEAPESTRRKGAAISISPPASFMTLSSRIPGALEAAPPIPVGTRAACLLTP
jgi:putative transposase